MRPKTTVAKYGVTKCLNNCGIKHLPSNLPYANYMSFIQSLGHIKPNDKYLVGQASGLHPPYFLYLLLFLTFKVSGPANLKAYTCI